LGVGKLLVALLEGVGEMLDELGGVSDIPRAAVVRLRQAVMEERQRLRTEMRRRAKM